MLFCWTFIPAIVGFIEGIIYATSSDEEFDRKYNKNSIQLNQISKIKIPDKVINSKIIDSKTVKWSRVKLREKPNATSSILEYLLEGTHVDVIQEEGDWSNIIATDKSYHGWVLTNSLDSKDTL